ncbi:hypothetical protein B1748_23455 [Paenibacillus sp. MY03]|uniref:hypothetical protein n=1 Tax=Paenibacillus sp. MY03 TaxID=302980 RepID=UPI000B3CEFC8|nr:hypothetical protein [Paenibacillus sp. MY03]OUS72968.1 hypothetical protein B1748_23455 [Paenibacillus sp. MY03]
MGHHQNIDFFRFPKQGDLHRVEVTFNRDLENKILGRMLRNDHEEPGVTIIMLDDGRVVLDTECQYSLI